MPKVILISGAIKNSRHKKTRLKIVGFVLERG